MILEIDDVKTLDQYSHIFEELTYKMMGEYGIKGRRFFMKGGDQRSHHIHAFNKGRSGVIRHLAFRDYLSEFPEKVKEYEHLKMHLTQKHRLSNEKYSAGKHNLIQKLEKEALEYIKDLY